MASYYLDSAILVGFSNYMASYYLDPMSRYFNSYEVSYYLDSGATLLDPMITCHHIVIYST